MTETHQTHKDVSSIRVTHRDDRSLPMSLVLFLVRCFRSQLNSGTPKHSDGSIEFSPSKSHLSSCTLSKRTVCDVHIYDVVPPNKPTKGPEKRIYYFAGGSWQEPPSSQHWKICAKMAKDMPEATVSMVSTPLAPNNPAPSSFPWCMKLYRALMAAADEAGERVILAGDSSGANIALSLVLEALREDAENMASTGLDMQQIPHAMAVMAISPSTDLTRKNPDIQKIAPHDPLLTPDVIKQTAKAWHADWDPADRRVSPVNADVSLLARRGVKVHGVTAGYDVLSPDGIIFRDSCAREGVKGEWLQWEKQMHCFVLMMPYGIREAKEAVEWVVDVLRKE
ncbi:esterase/lipase [Dothidotthia symphoricarpi CBS 119687]|uniref:Esterase/lipase n=1 Tax=Dothidotthia symphoricarpi CBS 119687 TaxID=1392245 RepID=A0A6A6A094_9PLEO|nr:esterase/lipase [Dothidotthia symphoricarpi CBS 119687]KAF2125432.1 esterase/lipase [Dothidotthia symphoricarpi CBS 119687]